MEPNFWVDKSPPLTALQTHIYIYIYIYFLHVSRLVGAVGTYWDLLVGLGFGGPRLRGTRINLTLESPQY